MIRPLRAAVAVCLASALCLPVPALASEAKPSAAADAASSGQLIEQADAHEGNTPCMPAQEQLDAYAADGTLEARLAFQESLGNGSFDSELIEHAQHREAQLAAGDGASALSVPTNWKSGMSTTGNAHVLALRVSFPEGGSDEPAGVPPADDSADALQNIIGPITAGVECDASPDAGQDPAVNVYPYESLHDYYYRSSYQQLEIDGATFDYTAAHPASYYSWNMESLFTEAIAALDDRIDYSKFDGNGDSLIDAVYLHFSCSSPQWGTEWWSNERQATSEAAAIAYDGVRLWNIVTLHNPSNSPDGVRTAIHETGHVLGLPDLYSYNGQSTSTGSLTFDMMDTNTGDHNAFSKWMLGWIADEDITRIVADDQGITVKRGTEPAQTIATPPGQTQSASVEASLSTYAATQSCGGIVACSSSHELIDGAGLFSSLYLVQYDSFANNQSVTFDMEHVGTVDLPSGFRVFRVQGELRADGSDFAHTNMLGHVHDQLIELVDPDGDIPHQNSNGVLYATGATEYGCMFREGDLLSPTTAPSTNFYEQLNLGFTGLSLSFGACDDSSGTLRVSYSSEHKPDPTNFTITRADDRPVANIDSLSLKTSVPAQINTEGMTSPDGGQTANVNPYILVAGQAISTKPSISGSDLTVQFAYPAALHARESSIELVFPARAFVIGVVDGQKVYSPEIRISLALEPSPAIQAENVWQGTNVDNYAHAVSNIVTSEDGAQYFFQAASGTLRLCAIDPADPTRVDITPITLLETPLGTGAVLQAFATGPSSAFVLAKSSETIGSGGVGFWIDTAAKTVTAYAENLPLSGISPVACATTMLFSEYSFQSGTCLVAITPNEDGTASARYGYTAYSSFQDVASYDGASEVALWSTSVDGGVPGVSAAIYDTATIVSAVRAEGFDSFDELSQAGFPPLTLAPAKVSFEEPSAYELSAAAKTDAGYYAILRGFSAEAAESASVETRIAHIGAQGHVDGRAPLSIEESLPSCKLVPARYGTLAAVFSSAATPNAPLTQRTVFLSDELDALSKLSTSSASAGAWLQDGRWLGIGWTVQPLSPGAGSPETSAFEEREQAATDAAFEAGESLRNGRSAVSEHEGEYVLYTLTGTIDEKPVDPPIPVDPDDPDNPGGSGEQGGSGTDGDFAGSDGSSAGTAAPTGDNAPLAPLAIIAAIAALVVVVAAVALTRSRRR